MLSLWVYSLPLSWRFSRASFRSVLKVNEFTLAGAVLADSLGRGADKKNGGEPTHSSPKSATFSKEYNTPAQSCNGLLHPFRVRNDVAKHPERIQYAQGTLRPCNPRAVASYCLILPFLNCRDSRWGTRAKLSEFAPILHQSNLFRKQKRRGVECTYPPEALDSLYGINTNNSRPKRPLAYRQTAIKQ